MIWPWPDLILNVVKNVSETLDIVIILWEVLVTLNLYWLVFIFYSCGSVDLFQPSSGFNLEILSLCRSCAVFVLAWVLIRPLLVWCGLSLKHYLSHLLSHSLSGWLIGVLIRSLTTPRPLSPSEPLYGLFFAWKTLISCYWLSVHLMYSLLREDFTSFFLI